MSAIFALGLLIVSCFLGFTLAKSRRGRIGGGLLSLSLTVLGLFSTTDPLLVLKIIPIRSMFLYSSFFAYAVAIFVPTAIRLGRTKAQRLRLAVLLGILGIVALSPFRYFLLPPAASYSSRIDEDGICLQSSMDTCSAAAAVTLLRQYGIETTEGEVAELAFTKEGRGTHILGLYRALRILTADQENLRIRIRDFSFDELARQNRPAIITVGVSRNPDTAVEKALVEKYQWDAGVVHQVVYLGPSPTTPDHFIIGEPSIGKEIWPEYHLRALFRGVTVTLE